MNKVKTMAIAKDLVVDYPEVKYLDTTHILGKEYPVLVHKIDQIRGKDVSSSDFQIIVDEITTIELVEATRNFKLEEYDLETPICKMIGHRIAGKKMVFAPIMRAGLGMTTAAKRLYPKACVGHIGMYRDENTSNPVEYYWKMPGQIEERVVFVLDPMLATGGSANAAISKLKMLGCKSIKFVGIVAAPQGIDVLQRNHPDVDIYVGAVDLGLNKNNYIVPGLGDAGDRIFGTK